MAVALNPKQEEMILAAVVEGPPIPVGGPLSNLADKLFEQRKLRQALSERMKVSGFSVITILQVLTMIGTFWSEHGDDIEAIWQAILDLFPKKA